MRHSTILMQEFLEFCIRMKFERLSIPLGFGDGAVCKANHRNGVALRCRAVLDGAATAEDKAGFVPYTDSTMAIDSKLTVEPIPGSTPGTVILRLTGPLILNNVLPLRGQFRNAELPRLTILDFAGVSYIDSACMSEIINHEVYCRDKSVRLILVGVTPRVLSMLEITRLDKVLTLAATVEEAGAVA